MCTRLFTVCLHTLFNEKHKVFVHVDCEFTFECEN